MDSSIVFIVLCMSMFRPQSLGVIATADAMATSDLAGLGGIAHFPDGSYTWFQCQSRRSEAQHLWPWVGQDMQKHIATWELLARFAVTFCVESKLPVGHPPAVCHQGTDNSAADASAAKGITMTSGMSHVLSQYFLFMRRSQFWKSHTSPAIKMSLQMHSADLNRSAFNLPSPLDLKRFSLRIPIYFGVG